MALSSLNMSTRASFSLEEIAQHLEGQLESVHAAITISGVGTIEQAKVGDLCFLENEKYQKYLTQTKAAAVLVSYAMAPQVQSSGKPMIIVANPKLAFSKVIRLFHPQKRPPVGIHSSAIIGQNTVIDPSACIGPNCVIGDNVLIKEQVIIGANVVIGDNCTIAKDTYIYPNVSIYSNVSLGENNIIHSGVVLGGDGFGFIQDKIQWVKIPHVGGVEIGNNVEIGANTTIDRGMINNTVIEEGVIIDNLVQIAHNVHIGAYTAIAACVGIAGSAIIGAQCQIGGGTIINGHITIPQGTYFIGGSQVGNSIKKPGVYSSGIPAKEYTGWIKNIARFHQLDEMAHRLKVLENKLKSED